MITYIATLTAHPGKEQELADVCAQLAKKVQNEDGCLMCIPHVTKDDPSKIVLFEKYKDQAAHAEHMQSVHLQEGAKQFKELAAGTQVVFLSEL